MSKGARHREARRRAEAELEARARAEAEAQAERSAFFAAFEPDDGEDGPALPCPECGAFGRRWATPEARAQAIAAFDAEWGLAAAPDDDRRAATCPACGVTTVIPGG